MCKTIKVTKLKKAMDKEIACYVLITCSPPNGEGKMDVELSYEGDETLAAFLVENAVQVFDRKTSQRESQ
ncbi:MAG: hypothetical protein A3D96_02730 [Chlamydiae bacterium RIFCSPHIGHO2_12_FULL_44_59]|nr:MAG: hypothetical protein A2796_07080 [Chlamydiae bacterium RIFCSPHIGHO2_01_FULL_44_39]OGN57032.1 MAG: hypothetical protein A3C42_05545 [Chlamydiae bacterium RIFCSPHIGHO2_02_FULL_45_9]OGN60999.1 MAG: hypothetical protein A3D96_02730 [Chlamydiae bacterium RIFCSPHIGHO2_12_FULL_44_59]OGN66775.1 MAG: hypothetical protein A2978_00215 [Chlamydiae bacterium RIFCSPLOWO2_01_FULL_44_52]OGN69969.1 MAG: hypothetical protein A3I67_01530 [Chlamydiae bacterium RIFCSPLOWO2_02_FULL_45_22]OGN71040.1 MAG: hyp